MSTVALPYAVNFEMMMIVIKRFTVFYLRVYWYIKIEFIYLFFQIWIGFLVDFDYLSVWCVFFSKENILVLCTNI